MSLEEKLATLPPELKQQVEDYIDFLVSKKDNGSLCSGISEQEPDEKSYVSDNNCVSSPAKHSPQAEIIPGRPKNNSSGIILAEEKIIDSNPDVIDFADINSRFGHTPKGEGEHKEHGRLRRLLDWM